MYVPPSRRPLGRAVRCPEDREREEREPESERPSSAFLMVHNANLALDARGDLEDVALNELSHSLSPV